MEAGLALRFSGSPTELCCVKGEPPWKVVRGFPLDSGANLVHLNNVSGGIFGGDVLRLSVEVGESAEAQITTTGATRLYRPRLCAAEARLQSRFALARGSLLEYLPDAVIPFRDARVLQHNEYTLAEGATLFCWDTIAPGRLAMGERFAYERLKIASDITVQGRPVLSDRLLLEPRRWPMSTAARFGSHSYLVTFVALRAGSTAREASNLEQALQDMLHGHGSEDAAWGVSTLHAHGVLVRGVLHSHLQIPAILQRLWATAKYAICGRTAVPPRKMY